MFRLNRTGRRGLTLHAHYTYSHAMDWNPNESAAVNRERFLDPDDFSREYASVTSTCVTPPRHRPLYRAMEAA